MARNTDLADVNEIYCAYVLNNNKFPDVASEKQYTKKFNLLTQEQGLQQIGRAIVMAQDFLSWAKKHGYEGLEKVYWTARPGFSFKAVTGIEVDQKKNPTDVLIKFRRGGFLDLSAKSTSGKGDIGFKNPGVGTVEKDLNIKLNDINKEAIKVIMKDFDLPASATSRKQAIRKDKATKMVTEKIGQAVLNEMRDLMLQRVNMLDQPKRRNYIIGSWIDAKKDLFPPYVKVTGKGTKAPYTADVEDPLNNPKLKAILEQKIMFEKVGNESIGVKAGTKKILKMRFKYESEKLASSLKMSGDPW